MAKKKNRLPKAERRARHFRKELARVAAKAEALREVTEREKKLVENSTPINVRLFDWDFESKQSDAIMEETLIDKVCEDENFSGTVTHVMVSARQKPGVSALLVSFDGHNEQELLGFADKMANQKLVVLEQENVKHTVLAARHTVTNNVFVKRFCDYGRVAFI